MRLADTLTREVQQAARGLKRTPGFTGVAVVMLALGLGAATAIFALLDAVVLRPLPYRHAERLVDLSSPVPLLKGQTRWGIARHEMFYFLERGRTLENLGVYQVSDVTVATDGPEDRPERLRWVSASASLLEVLGFVPDRGRLIVRDDNHAAIPTVVVLSNEFAQRRFGGADAAIGKTLRVEGFPITVVGVLAKGDNLPDIRADLWVPALVDSTTVMNNHTWTAIGKLAAGFTANDAAHELAPLTASLGDEFPGVYSKTFIKNTGFYTDVRPLRTVIVGDIVTRALWTLFGAISLVLIIAAANVANLFLVRFEARSREVAVRYALGAGRFDLVKQSLMESLLFTSAASILAVGVAQLLLRSMVVLAPSALPRISEIHLGSGPITFMIAAAMVGGCVLGMLPLIGRRNDLGSLTGARTTASRERMFARRVLVSTQMAFAVVLLAGAALMLRTFQNLQAVRPGFDPTGVLTMEISLPRSRYSGNADLATNFFEQLAARIQALPGVRNVGFASHVPLLSSDWCIGVTLQGPTPESAKGACPPAALVSPGYFEAMGIRVEGRTPDWQGMNAHDGVMVVSKAFAEHWWPSESALGKGLRFNGTKPPWYRVSGIAEDVRGMGVTEPPIEIVYFPMRPIPDAPLWTTPRHMHLVIRTAGGNPETLSNVVVRLVNELEAEAAVANVQTMETVLARSMAKHSFTMFLLVIASGMALLLSGVGLYGLISYVVQQRRKEIGVRLAVGARVADVTALVLRQSMGLALLGVGIGLVTAFVTTRFLSTLLFGVQPGDPATFAVVPAVLLTVAAIASYAPAHRAAHIDPLRAMRAE
jgi:putative ABC transport system permease protein